MYASAEMEAISRPPGEWRDVVVFVVDQKQVNELVDWVAESSTAPVDVRVRRSAAIPFEWRIGCYGWPEARRVTRKASRVGKLLHEGVQERDTMVFSFQARADAMRFQLLPGAALTEEDWRDAGGFWKGGKKI